MRVIAGGKRGETRRKKIIAAIMIGFGKMTRCRECGEAFFDREPEEMCPRCLFVEDARRPLAAVSEFERRRMLKDWVGKAFLREMDEGELLFVLERLREMGYARVKKGTLREAAEDSRRGMVAKIREEAARTLGENWERRLSGFCRKTFGKEALEWLSLPELRRVWGFLRGANKSAKGVTP